MEKIIRKTLYTAVGIVAGTTERLQKTIDELVSKGKLSEEEGKKVVDDVVKSTDRKGDYEGRFRNIVESVLSKLNLPQGEAYEKLGKRVKSLEVKLGLLAKELDAQRKAAAEAKAEEKGKKATKKKK